MEQQADTRAQAVLVSCEVQLPTLGAPGLVAVARDVRPGVPVVAESVDASPHSFAFSGRIDGAALPPQREHAFYSHLVSALVEAKAATDVILRAHLPVAMPSSTKRPRMAAAAPARSPEGAEDAAGDSDDASATEE